MDLSRISGIIKKQGKGPGGIGLPAPDFISAETTVDNTDAEATIPHGLGALPTLVMAVMRCKSAEHGYAIGDEIPITHQLGTAADNGVSVHINTTNIVIITGTAFQIFDASQNHVVFTAGSWKWVVRCWR